MTPTPIKPQPHWQLADWLQALEQLDPQQMDLRLERMHKALRRCKLTPIQLPIITVGGTNGKGTTVHCLNAIYTQQGYRTGLYTSPHLLCFNERIQINHQTISDQEIVAQLKTLVTKLEDLTLTYFEMTTLLAIAYFIEQQVDVFLLEVGLGGRLDAVNCLDADVAIVTSIGLDHTQWLGNTLTEIAGEKAGIFRAGAHAIYAGETVETVMAEQAQKRNSQYWPLGEAFHFQEFDTKHWSWSSTKQRLEQLPRPQGKLSNTAAALMCVELMQPRLPVSRESIEQALAGFSLKGRLQQLLLCDRRLLVDVAHNPQAILELTQAINKINQQAPLPRIHYVVGFQKDKAIQECIEILRKIEKIKRIWYISDLPGPRGAQHSDWKENLSTLSFTEPAHYLSHPLEAIQKAITQSNPDDLIVICGSFLMAEAALRLEKQDTGKTG